MDQLPQFAVYAIRQAEKLEDAFSKGGAGRFTERKRWVRAKELFDDAKRKGLRLPIIFADAGNKHDCLLYYGFIRDLNIEDSGTTTYDFEGLCEIAKGTRKNSLKLHTGKELSGDYIHSYAIVQAPSYIRGG
jgi:hypothetical protein